MPGDARRYSWEPFRPGHTLSLRHGASSPRTIQPLADELAAAMVVAAPWLRLQAMVPVVTDWSHAEARCAILRLEVDRLWTEHDQAEGEDREAAAAALEVAERRLDGAMARAGRLRRDLALTPTAFSRMVVTMASSPGDDPTSVEIVKGLAAVGRELRANAELEAGESDV